MIKLSYGVLGKPLRITSTLFLNLPSAYLLFLLYCLLLLSFMAKGKVWLSEVDLFFSLIILHYYFILIKSCMSFLSITYQLSYLTLPICEILGRFGNCFMHLREVWLDLVNLLLTISNGILMHSNLSCNYLL